VRAEIVPPSDRLSRARPAHVCDTFSDAKAKRGLANYVEYT